MTYDERKLLETINHALEQQRQKLKRCLRNSNDWHQFGMYCLENENTGELLEAHVDPLQLGRELGVIGEYDSVDYRR
jgi:hypothetical protein